MHTIDKKSPSCVLYEDYLILTTNNDDNYQDYHFHYYWLRHNCPSSIHPLTKERVLCPSKVSLSIKPKTVSIEGDELHIEWQEGHQTSYKIDFLIDHAYAKNVELQRPNAPTIEAVSIQPEQMNDAGWVKKAFEKIETYGFVYLRQFGEDTERFIAEIEAYGLAIIPTHFGRYEDLRTDNTTNKNTDQLGYTDAAVDLHADQPFIENPPKYQALQSLRAADKGGESVIADGVKIANYLKQIDRPSFDMLSKTEINFDRKQQNFQSCTRYPLIECDGEEVVQIRHSYFTMAPINTSFDTMLAWYRAYKAFQQLVYDEKNHNVFLLHPGDIIIYNNHRMLHARTSFTGQRWVRGIYFDKA